MLQWLEKLRRRVWCWFPESRVATATIEELTTLGGNLRTELEDAEHWRSHWEDRYHAAEDSQNAAFKTIDKQKKVLRDAVSRMDEVLLLLTRAANDWCPTPHRTCSPSPVAGATSGGRSGRASGANGGCWFGPTTTRTRPISARGYSSRTCPSHRPRRAFKPIGADVLMSPKTTRKHRRKAYLSLLDAKRRLDSIKGRSLNLRHAAGHTTIALDPRFGLKP